MSGGFGALDGLLVRLVGVEVLLGRLLVVELGEAEHRVRRPALVVRVLLEEVLEHRDGVPAAVARVAVVEIDLRVVLRADGLHLVLEGALEDVARRRAVLRDHLGVVLDVAPRARRAACAFDGPATAAGRRAPACRDRDCPRATQASRRATQRRPACRARRLTCRPPGPSGSPRRAPSSPRFFWLVSLLTAGVFWSLRPQATSMMPTSERTTRS